MIDSLIAAVESAAAAHVNDPARNQIDLAYRRAIAASEPTLPSVYAAFNRAVADLVDDLYATAAEHSVDDLDLIAKAEQAIKSTCCRRAAELVGGGAR